ncbi:PAS domain-containing protein [Myroides odoratimimus]|uniref:LuxR C-terminal-related transcriptional regulator n=1 Tax=Myroides odoratimimus TaxID=76832 RepID=UPI0025779B21|nr:LuxR C-terminal-related transcriptional regulator [Myroides odoratimimus]MDM1398113.1 PAS domain-containing protein [Myroides odoratimimus]
METIKNTTWLNLYNNHSTKKQKQHKESEELSIYFFILDYTKSTVLFVNSAFSRITGYNNDKFDLDFLIDIIHKDDLNYFFEKEEQGTSFTSKIQYNDHFRYIKKYSYRIIKADGNSIRVAQESQALEINENGDLSKALITHKIINQDTFCEHTDYKIFDKVQNVYLDLNNNFNLTNRELEILTLIRQGLSSKQISALLNVSNNTIQTHRKNILAKTSSNSFIEVVKKLSYADY